MENNNAIFKKAQDAARIFDDVCDRLGIEPIPTTFAGDESKREMFQRAAGEYNPFPGPVADTLKGMRIPAMQKLFEAEVIPQTAAMAAVLSACSSVATEIGRLRGADTPDAATVCDVAFAGLQANRVFMSYYTEPKFQMARMMNGASITNAIAGEWHKYPCKDGRLISMHAYRQEKFAKLVNALGLSKPAKDYNLMSTEQDVPEVAAAAAKWNAQELEEWIFKNDASAVVVRSREEFEESDLGKAVMSMPIVKVGKTGGDEKAVWGAPNERGPLSGIKVLDLTHIIAGPACSRILAEYGADVLLVRRSGGFAEQESCMNEFDGWAGKRLINLDFNDAEQLARVKELIREADVVTYTYRDGILDKFGLSEAGIRALNPNVVYSNLNCFSDTVWRNRPGWAPCAEDISGISIRNGSEEHPQNLSGVPMDYFPGFLLAIGTLLALRNRLTIGGGWKVTTSLTRGAMYLHECADLCASAGHEGSATVSERVDAPVWDSILQFTEGCAIPGTNGFPSPGAINTAWPFRPENLVFTEGDNWSQV